MKVHVVHEHVQAPGCLAHVRHAGDDNKVATTYVDVSGKTKAPIRLMVTRPFQGQVTISTVTLVPFY
jgi:hypothetical protein